MPSRQETDDLDLDFPPHVLREYSVLADGERGLLMGPKGDICWMCAPRWHSDAVFSSLIGGRGVYVVAPSDRPFVWGGSYEDGSLIWCGRWVTRHQVVETREALVFPGDPHTTVLLRRVLATDGDTAVDVLLEPRAGFGKHRLSDLACRDGVWTARCGPLHIRWSGAADAHWSDDGLQLRVMVKSGDHHDLVLEISDLPLTAAPPEPERAWAETRAAWDREVPTLQGGVADRDAGGAFAVLRGLTSTDGGMVAGATTSLPERAEQGRNYDYRYSWIRDQCYAGQAVATWGAHPLLDSAVGFVSARLLADGPDLKPAYTVEGGPVPSEQDLDLPGYPGGTGKTGNWVNQQFQLDAFGEALLLFAAAAGRDHLEREQWPAVRAAVQAIKDRRHEPDAGIWELQNTRWAHSRLTCAAGLRAIAAYAPRADADDWSRLADALIDDVSQDCLHPSGRWQRAPGDQKVDASLLLPAIRGALPTGDPRTVATLEAVTRELGEDGYVYRFRQDDRPLGDAEGAFLLCGFATALATYQQGRETEAIRWFERNRAACGPTGLFAEEYDVRQRQLRGNFPQAFVHAMLLETSHRLAR